MLLAVVLLLGCDGGATVSDSSAALEALASAAAAAPYIDAPGEWPRWRGPRVDGVSTETSWSNDWPASGPRKIWEAQVGVGFSSLAIADGRLYTLGRAASPTGRDLGDDIVWCLDATTGQEIWRHTYPCQLVPNQYEGGPNSTPTVDGPLVYTLGKEGQFFCLDAKTGKVVWEKMLTDVLGVEMPGWGFACSPLVLGDLVIVDGGRTAAFHKETGELVWRTDVYNAGYGSPIAFWREDQPWLAVLNCDRLMVIDPATGREAASFDWSWNVQVHATTPVVVDDLIFISTAYDQGCALLRFTGDALVEVYRNKEMENHMNSCVAVDGHLYGYDGMSMNSRAAQLKCLDLATGQLEWAQRGLGCGSLLAAGDRLIALSDQGELVILRASPEKYEELARAKVLDGKCWTPPALAGGRIFARNADGRLVCVDVRGAGD